jgi:hypothetical protein
MKQLFLLLLCIGCITACDSKLKKENEELRQDIDERREALAAKQLSELAEARREMAIADSLLTEVTQQHDELHEWVMSHATRLNDHSPEVVKLNNLRAQRDSLRVVYETQAHKVKFFLKKTEGRN